LAGSNADPARRFQHFAWWQVTMPVMNGPVTLFNTLKIF